MREMRSMGCVLERFYAAAQDERPLKRNIQNMQSFIPELAKLDEEYCESTRSIQTQPQTQPQELEKDWNSQQLAAWEGGHVPPKADKDLKGDSTSKET